MNTNTDQTALNFEQFLKLVKKLSNSEKVQLHQELGQEIVSHNLLESSENTNTDKPLLFYQDNVLVFEAESIENSEVINTPEIKIPV
ncbi:hypothetical protein [Aphanothece hegewaldii]|nr:hypothetical protein [Aphanothece hegewaldii]